MVDLEDLSNKTDQVIKTINTNRGKIKESLARAVNTVKMIQNEITKIKGEGKNAKLTCKRELKELIGKKGKDQEKKN